jgi:biotin transporter BioY
LSRHQKKVFWAIFIVFCIAGTISIYLQGAFDQMSFGGAIILTTLYLIVGFFIRLYVKSNIKEIDK